MSRRIVPAVATVVLVLIGGAQPTGAVSVPTSTEQHSQILPTRPISAQQVDDDEAPSEFEVDGTEVNGAGVAGRAPVLRPGRYVDTAPGRGRAKHYILHRAEAGSTMYAGVTGRPAGPSPDDRITLQLWTVSGTPCGTASSDDADIGRQNSLVTAAVASSASDEDPQSCADATELHLVVEANYGESTLAGQPTEIVVIEEPAIDRGPTLPGPIDKRVEWGPPMPVERREPVVGGASFSTAPQIASGSYRSTIRPGEVRMFRVRMDWGRRLRTEVTVNRPGAELREQLPQDLHLDLRMVAPTRAEVGVEYAELPGDVVSRIKRDRKTRLVQMTYDVRYRNRGATERPLVAGTALAGDYYILLTAAADPEDRTYPIAFALDVALEDTSDGIGPQYVGGADVAGPITEPPVPAAEPGLDLRSMAATGLLWAGLVLLLLGGGSLFVARRLSMR